MLHFRKGTAAAGVMLALFKKLLGNDKDVPACDCCNWLKLWLGFYLNNAILPICMLYTYNPYIQWGGIWYVKKRDKVRRLSKLHSLTSAWYLRPILNLVYSEFHIRLGGQELTS